jgi:hypothetical protein
MSAFIDWVDDAVRSPDGPTYFEALVAALALLVALAWPRLGDRVFGRVENFFGSLAARAGTSLFLAFALPIGLRLLTLPLYPPPQPAIHDEFSHLLIADTLLAGRLANPPHPMWKHFETIHVIFDPSYASKYPIGQGFILALPQWFGLPAYTGVWLSCGLMSAAIFWMLRHWLSPGWAFAAVAVVLLRVSVLSLWMHSYWGGAFAATGGALAFGAFTRLLASPGVKHALLLGLGIAILANTRPYEGAAVALVLGVALLAWLARSKAIPAAAKLRRIVLPLAFTSAATMSFIGLHNWSVTGSVWKLPYMRNREIYGTPQNFYWQKPIPPVPIQDRQITENYRWQLMMHERGRTFAGLLEATWEKLDESWRFFLGAIWLVPFLCLPVSIRRPGFRVSACALGLVMVAVLCYPFYFPHYLGPVTGVIVLFSVSGFILFKEVRFRGKPFGRTAVRLLFVAGIVSFFYQISMDYAFSDTVRQPKKPRTQVVEALKNLGGKHLVFVRYAGDHNFHKEIVYNAADIDASSIVWARDMGPFANQRLLGHYKERRPWIFEPDLRPPHLAPYENDPFSNIPNLPPAR